MLALLEELKENEMQWFTEFGIGYYPVKDDPLAVYDENYFHKYEAYTDTKIGEIINGGRVNLVMTHCFAEPGPLVDVGVGCGDFVTLMKYYLESTYGIDINPYANKWLEDRGMLWDNVSCNILTLFDVIEHIDNPTELFSKVKGLIVLSTPIYENAESVIKSKHFRKNEHFWYFTLDGIITYMKWFGFEYVYHDFRETEAGRDGIGSFVFKRIV